ncbi:3-hydroxybutyrate dehydrogenase, partial [mine drainage metagenome]
MRLIDQVALVTGAAGGIGREIARTFAREGARVAIADLDRDAAGKTVAELTGEDRQAVAVAMDVTNEAQVEAGMARVIEAYGRIDILVSNAGIQRVCPLEDLSFEDWRQVLAVHLDGAFLTTRAALRQMY